MIGVTLLPLFDNYASIFKGSMESFRTLTDQEKINKQPERIRIKQSSKMAR